MICFIMFFNLRSISNRTLKILHTNFNVQIIVYFFDENVCYLCFVRMHILLTEQKFLFLDDRSVSIQLVSSGKDVNVQIGQNNKCFLNVEVFDHLKNEGEPTDVNPNDDLVKTIIHMKSTSGIEVAKIQEKLLNSLSGEQLEEINKDLEERFGVKIVVAREGCIVLVLQKTQAFANRLEDRDVLIDLLSVLFELAGFSNDNLSEISLRVDLTIGDNADVDAFKKSQSKGKGMTFMNHYT